MNKFLLPLTFISLTSCALVPSIEPQCRSADPAKLGALYAQKSRSKVQFEQFNDICQKLDVPIDKAVFSANYDSTMIEICKTKNSFFKAIYKSQFPGGAGSQKICEDFKTETYDADLVAKDAQTAYQLKQQLNENEIRKKRDEEAILKAGFATNNLLYKISDSNSEIELKRICEKYNLFVSDLDDLRWSLLN